MALGLPVPLLRPRGGEGRGPQHVRSDRDASTGRWGNACRAPAPALQSEAVAPAYRLVARVAPSVAFWLGLRILAAGPATYRQYSDCGVPGRQSKDCAPLPRWHRPGEH